MSLVSGARVLKPLKATKNDRVIATETLSVRAKNVAETIP